MKKTLFTMALMAMAAMILPAQEIEQPFKDIIPPSPTVANLMRFEEVPVNLYTGAPNIGIPIFQKKLGGGMAIGLQLSYNTSGIRVDQRSGWTGTGWSLFAGGTISRTVKDLPDEINDTGTKIGALHNGFHNWDNFTPAQTDEFLWKANRGQEKYDSQWDVYQFNFMGKTGRFVVVRSSNGGLEAKLISRDERIKIELTPTVDDAITEFVLTDAMGYQYTFGAFEVTSSEVHWSSQDQWNNWTYSNNINNIPTVVRSAWHLVNVKRPNGQQLCSFTYQTVNEGYRTPTNEKGHELLNPLSPTFFNEITGQTNRSYLLPKYTSTYNTISVASQKLQQINFNDGTSVSFDLSAGHPELGGGSYLERINIHDVGGAVLQYYDLDYHISTQGRMFLTDINHHAGSELQQYSFEYHNMDELPDFESPYQDQWGYYNGQNNALPINPSLYNLADPTKVSTGVLTKINYPIGGSKEFVHESNTFSYIGDQPVSLANNASYQYGAGVRIKEIKFTEGGNTKVSTSYTYDEVGGNGKSSGSFDGVLLQDKNYLYNRKYLLDNNQAYTVNYRVYEDRHVLYSTSDRNHFIGYKQVIKRQTGNGYTLSTLSSPQDHPSFSSVYGYPFADVPDQSYKTGLLLKEEVFNEAGDRLASKTNTYKTDHEEQVIRSVWMFENQFQNCEFNRLYDNYTDYVAAQNTTQGCGSPSSYLGGIGQWEVGTRADLIETQSTQFFPDQPGSVPVVSRQLFTYNNENYQISKKTDIVQEGGKEYRYATHFYYPHNMPGSYYEPNEQNVIASMISVDNKYNELIATKTTKTEGASLIFAKTLNITVNKYGSETANDYKVIAYEVAETPASAASLEPRYEVVTYDSHGNPLEVRQVIEINSQSNPIYGTPVTYVWGYGKTRMVAQLNGVTNDQVEALLGVDYDLGQGGLSPVQESALRAMSEAQVITMAFHPLYGMVTQTDPNGKQTTFEYDAFGRLKLVRDFEGNILSKNEYNLKGL